jgi:hypothetical protein
MPKKILAWHFCADRDGKPVLRDGTPLKVGILRYKGAPEMCRLGLHASRRMADALQYAPGTWLSRVECWGSVEEQDDKLVCCNRRVLRYADVATALHRAACDVAEHAMLRYGVDDPRSWETIKTKRRWLLGVANDSELAAASWAAVGAASWAAVGAAAGAAARAAWAAAGAAARDEWEQILLARVGEVYDEAR